VTSLLYTDDEVSLRQAIRALLEDLCLTSLPLSFYDSGDARSAELLWGRLAVDVGVAGLLVPEHLGGAGATAREAATVLEELGRAAAPVPFLTSSVIATSVLLAMDDERFVTELASGNGKAVLAVPLTAMAGDWEPTVRLAGDGLTGTVTSVADASGADFILVPVPADEGVQLHVCTMDEVRFRPVISLDMTRQLFDVHFESAKSTALGPGTEAIDHALTVGAALLASEQLAIAQWCLQTTVSYLKVRHQFGRPLGSFQAIKHRLADLWARIELGHAAARHAAECAATGGADLPLAASLAAAFCSDLAVAAAEDALQLHAGIGMTWEHPIHIYLKRAKADQLALGTSDHHRARVAALVDLGAPLVHVGAVEASIGGHP